MNPEIIYPSAAAHQAEVEHNTNLHWKKVAQNTIEAKRLELAQKMKDLEELNQQFMELKMPSWVDSSIVIDKVKYL